MKWVILSSDPYKSNDYEQGLEVAMNLAEAELPVTVLQCGAFARALVNAPEDAVFKKKLKQLELFEIPVETYPDSPFSGDFEGAVTF